MATRKRYYKRKSSRGKPQKPYKSWLEYDLHKGPMKGLPYECAKLPYSINTTYTPDFVNERKMILFEAKGRFEDSKEASKYRHFIRCNPEWELIFIFENPNTPMPGARRRLDGTRFSHANWAEKHGFKWCSPKTVRGGVVVITDKDAPSIDDFKQVIKLMNEHHIPDPYYFCLNDQWYKLNDDGTYEVFEWPSPKTIKEEWL